MTEPKRRGLALKIILYPFWKTNKTMENAAYSLERYIWNRPVKKICKKYRISKIYQKIFLDIRKEILKRVNDEQEKDVRGLDHAVVAFAPLITNRVYELNTEFPTLVKMEYFHSANAITRQMVDLYIRMLYCRHKPAYVKILLEKPDQPFPRVGKMKEEIKTSKMDLPYLKDIIDLSTRKPLTKEDFLEATYSDFEYFSEMYHPSSLSFALNMWVVGKSENGKKTQLAQYHIDDPEKAKEDGARMLIFAKHSFIPNWYVEKIILQFFFYSGLVLTELGLIDKRNKEART